MKQRDVIWISLESVRYDHTSLSNYHRDTTPFLNQFAERNDAISFENCYSHDVWTRGAIGSVFTGMPSSAHGARTPTGKLSEDYDTVASNFTAKGYRTVGISPNPQITCETGLARGFDTYYYLHPKELHSTVKPRDLLFYLLQFRRHSGGFTIDPNENPFNYLNYRIAKKELSKKTERPLFMFTHLGDTHHPFCPPINYRDTFTDSPKQALRDASDMTKNLHRHIANGTFSEEKWSRILAMYDSCLKYTDSIVENIITVAENKLQDPIIVIASDHGELLGENDILAHGLTTNRAVTHIPFIVSGIDEISKTEAVVQPVDIMEQIATECGIKYPSEIAVPIGNREMAFVQRSEERAEKKVRAIEKYGDVRNRYRVADVTAGITLNYRISVSDRHVDVYKAENDIEPLSKIPDSCSPLIDRVREFASKYSIEDLGSDVKFSDKARSHLSDLGYLE